MTDCLAISNAKLDEVFFKYGPRRSSIISLNVCVGNGMNLYWKLPGQNGTASDMLHCRHSMNSFLGSVCQSMCELAYSPSFNQWHSYRWAPRDKLHNRQSMNSLFGGFDRGKFKNEQVQSGSNQHDN